MSNSLQSHGLQLTRLPCPSLSLKVCSNFVSIESVMLFNHLILSCPLLLLSSIFPSIRVFLVSQLFTSGGQSIGVSASASVLPVSIQGWFPLGWTGLISLQSKGLSSHLKHHSSKASIPQCSAYFMVHLSHPFMTTGKTIALTIWTFVGKVMFLLLNMLSRFVIAFLLRSKHLLLSWLQSPSTVILKPKIIQSATVSIFSPSTCHEVMGSDAMIFVLWMLSFSSSSSVSYSIMSDTLWPHGINVQFSSVTQSCPTLCDPMNCSTPGLLVHHQLPEFTQTHVHRVGDAIQPSHPLLSPPPPAPNPSQRQGLFQWVNSSHEVARVLEFQHQSFQWTPRTDLL